MMESLLPEILGILGSKLGLEDILSIAVTNKQFREIFLTKSLCNQIANYFILPYNLSLIELKKYERKSKANRLYEAAKLGDGGIVEGLLDYGCKNTIICYAASGGHREIIDFMLELGEKNYDNAMCCAAQGGHREIIDLMLELGAKNYEWAMCCAARGGHRETIDLMLELGAKNYDEAMCHASLRGRREIIDLMLELGAKDYDAAMCFAAQEGHRER